MQREVGDAEGLAHQVVAAGPFGLDPIQGGRQRLPAVLTVSSAKS
jgi:hypothetical protein